MSFKIKDESVYLKYTEIWNKIEKSLNKDFIVNLFMMANT